MTDGLGGPFEPLEPGEPAGPSAAIPAPRSARRSVGVRRRRRLVGVVGAGLVVLVLALVTWYELEAHALGPQGRQVVVTIHEGEGLNAVTSSLVAQQVIHSSWAFRVSNIVGSSPSVLPGSYALHQNLTFGQVKAILDGGPNIFPIRVDPGFTLHEVAERIDSLPGHSATSFEKTAASGAIHSAFSPAGSDNLEGLLGSGTYNVLPGESDTAILTAMVTRFDAQATTAGVSATSASALGLTPYELITAASVVEKEGYIAKNMPDVARVIYNRLIQHTPLQMDSTVLYALGQDGGPVTPQDEQIQSPYNSYLNKGLPPTPICSPSPDALAAAAHPPVGSWLYFVVVDKAGTEAFADTFAEQLANEKLAQTRGVG
jgi:UPF0755 protein